MTLTMWLALGFILVVIFGITFVISHIEAKKKAKRILSSGKITNWREFNSICETLSSHGTDDLESADLWKKLQELKEASPNPTNAS